MVDREQRKSQKIFTFFEKISAHPEFFRKTFGCAGNVVKFGLCHSELEAKNLLVLQSRREILHFRFALFRMTDPGKRAEESKFLDFLESFDYI